MELGFIKSNDARIEQKKVDSVKNESRNVDRNYSEDVINGNDSATNTGRNYFGGLNSVVEAQECDEKPAVKGIVVVGTNVRRRIAHLHKLEK